MNNNTYLVGVGSVLTRDTSGEVVDIKGTDISSLVESGVLNFEHDNSKTENVLGRIVEAKKIFKKEDCDNELHLKYFKYNNELPYVFIKCMLFDGQGHSGALAAASMMRAEKELCKNDSTKKPMMGFSIEGSKLEKDESNINRCIVRKIALTCTPANRACIAEIYEEHTPTKIEVNSMDKSETLTTDIIKDENNKLMTQKVNPNNAIEQRRQERLNNKKVIPQVSSGNSPVHPHQPAPKPMTPAAPVASAPSAPAKPESSLANRGYGDAAVKPASTPKSIPPAAPVNQVPNNASQQMSKPASIVNPTQKPNPIASKPVSTPIAKPAAPKQVSGTMEARDIGAKDRVSVGTKILPSKPAVGSAKNFWENETKRTQPANTKPTDVKKAYKMIADKYWESFEKKEQLVDFIMKSDSGLSANDALAVAKTYVASESLKKAKIDREVKGVHLPLNNTDNGRGVSAAGAAQRIKADIWDDDGHTESMAKDPKKLHSKKLSEMKAMSKPNLPKSEQTEDDLGK